MNIEEIRSEILKHDEISLIKDWLGQNFKIELLFSSNIHEKSTKTFHENCDGKNNTLVLIESDTDRRFGGFTKLPWSSKEGWVEGNGNDFIFSLNKKSFFKNNSRKDCAIYNHPNCFPCFGGGCDIGLLGNCFVDNQSAHSYFQFSYGVGEVLDENSHFYFAGSDEYQVLKLEIFEVILL